MKKLKRANLAELAKSKTIISFLEQRRYVGGGSGTQEDPFTYDELMSGITNNSWSGGWVQGVVNNGNALNYCGGTGEPIYVSANLMYKGGTGPQANTIYDGGTGFQGYSEYNGRSLGNSEGGLFYTNEELLQKMKDICIAAGKDFSILAQYHFKEGSNRAGISDDRSSILVSQYFLENEYLSAADKYSILSHEVYHMENDVAYDMNKRTRIDRGDYSFSNEMTDGALSYFTKIYSLNTKEEVIDFLNKIYKNKDYYDIQRYKNEINAYEYELSHNHGISKDYRDEIEGKIYQYKEFINIINKNLINK